MISPEFLALLRCPESKQHLVPAPPELLARLESERVAGHLKNRAGKAVDKTIEEGLLREDGKRFYLIATGFPILIGEEGIDL
jgi:uncharacterized protein YbaR (Trm112 family)